MNKHAPEYDTYVDLLKGERARAWFQYDELRQRAKEIIYAKRQKVTELKSQRDRAHDALQDLLDFVYMIAPEADAEVLDEAKQLLKELNDE